METTAACALVSSRISVTSHTLIKQTVPKHSNQVEISYHGYRNYVYVTLYKHTNQTLVTMDTGYNILNVIIQSPRIHT